MKRMVVVLNSGNQNLLKAGMEDNNKR